MRYLLLMMIFTATCVADEYEHHSPYLLTDDYGSQKLADQHFSFASGATTITYLDYKVKITAEQCFSDKRLLVIAFPLEQTVSFQIQRVSIGRAPEFNIRGAVAKVTGMFRARVNMANPVRKRMVVPVQIAPVNEFTVSANEALIQGNQCYQKVLPRMVTGNEP